MVTSSFLVFKWVHVLWFEIFTPSLALEEHNRWISSPRIIIEPRRFVKKNGLLEFPYMEAVGIDV
jgi:hypothetical protein